MSEEKKNGPHILNDALMILHLGHRKNRGLPLKKKKKRRTTTTIYYIIAVEYSSKFVQFILLFRTARDI